MNTLKKTITCAFSKDGCTREQVIKISAIVGAIVVMLNVGKWVYGNQWYAQNKAAQEKLNEALKFKRIALMIQAVEAGLIIGPREFGAIKKIYYTNKYLYREANAFKDNLRKYFSNNQHQDQLIAKRDFWDWIAVYGK